MIPFTPKQCAAAYEFLRTLPPFCKWNLPPASEVVFRVKHLADCYGEYIFEGKHVITVSTAFVSQPLTLVRVMAHEMIHLRQAQHGEETKAQHNAAFRRQAARVCRLHGFDPKEF